MVLSLMRQWWWKRGYPRFYRCQAYQENPFLANAGSQERFEMTVKELTSLVQPTPEDTVLDLGGGDGRLSSTLFQGCRWLVILDFCQGAAEAARALPRNCSFVVGDMSRPPLNGSARFSKLFTYGTFPHFITEGRMPAVFHVWDGLLAPGGVLYIGDIPDRRRVAYVFARGFPRFLKSLLYGLRYYWAVSMANYFSRARLSRMLQTLGYDVRIIDQSPQRRFAKERFDLVARKR